MENEVKSRLYWPGGGIPRVLTAKRAPEAQRAGVGGQGPSSRRYVRPAPGPPLRSLQGLRARFAVLGLPSSSKAWVLGGYRYSPSITHPVYPGVPYPPRTTRARTTRTAVVTARCVTFGTRVGEPRGMRTHLVSGSQDQLYTVIDRFTGLHGRLTAL